MSSDAPVFRIAEIDCFERPLHYRLPFRFGAATVSQGVQAFVRVRIVTEDGRSGQGASAELMVPKWFDKRPQLSNDDNIDELRTSLAIARAAYLSDRAPRSAFAHCAAHMAECQAAGYRRDLPALAAAFGAAEIDKAVLDALCNALGISFFAAVQGNVVGFAPAEFATDVNDAEGDAFVRALRPRESIAVRHTIGLADVLRGHPAMVGDGLPESLEEVIARYGVHWFKIKLAGDAHTDAARIGDIARVLERLPHYGVTLDGNEQYESVEALHELLDELKATPALGRFVTSLAFVEQPLPRQRTFEAGVEALASAALLIDEADATIDAFPRARALGYTGVSSKSCKGLYKSLVNAVRCAAWNRVGARRYFLSAEDLTTPAGLALQQDLALASVLGVEHIERNGHHYIDGMAGASEREQASFLDVHRGLYERSHGVVRLAIRDGMLALRSLSRPGFASGAVPDWDALAPMRAPVSAAPFATPRSEPAATGSSM
jgi:L-alanine-DL-glutamate epimerase-like enolase superfamily enzyme